MAESSEVLRLRALLSFYNDENATVTGLARSLGEEKYTISRLLSAMEEEGLVDRSNNRHPKLTPKGIEAAGRYSDRVDTLVNYLLFKGVSMENARPDALQMALRISDESVDALRREEELESVKYEFRDRRKFSGSEFFSKVPDGNYKLSFIIYREKANNVTNVSMVNEGFQYLLYASREVKRAREYLDKRSQVSEEERLKALAECDRQVSRANAAMYYHIKETYEEMDAAIAVAEGFASLEEAFQYKY